MISAMDAFDISKNYINFDYYINNKILNNAEGGLCCVYITAEPYNKWLTDDYEMSVIENRIVDNLKEKGYIVENVYRKDNLRFIEGNSLYIEWNKE